MRREGVWRDNSGFLGRYPKMERKLPMIVKMQFFKNRGLGREALHPENIAVTPPASCGRGLEMLCRGRKRKTNACDYKL